MNRRSSQTPPERASELFEKLLATSDNALKTRERLFAHLKEELELLANLQEQHLFPILRKHRMQDLVNQEVNDNQATTDLLTEIAHMPKDSADFRDKVAELQRAFQQHIREDKKELLPAVLKLLNDEEAEAIADEVKNQVASTGEAGRGDVQPPREQDPSASGALRSRADPTRTGRETAQVAARAVDETARSRFAGLAEGGRPSTGRTFRMVSLRDGAAREMMGQASQNVQAVGVSGTMLAGAMDEIARAWLELTQRRWQACSEGFGRLTRCRSLDDVLAVQTFLIRRHWEDILDTGCRIAHLSVQASNSAARPATVKAHTSIRRHDGTA